MKVQKIIDRKDLIYPYLVGEEKKKAHQIPSDFPPEGWGLDPNAMDEWLSDNGYKFGTITGFKQWAIVDLSTEDLLSCAIVNNFLKEFGQTSQVLKDWDASGALEKFKPKGGNQKWYK